MFSKEDFENVGITEIGDILSANAGVEWVKDNTTIEITDSLEDIPICAKLFIKKFSQISERQSGITSESISGLSQSFATGNDNSLIWDLANQLLAPYLKSRISFVNMPRGW